MNPLATRSSEQSNERSALPAPPPYTSIVYKINDNPFDQTAPPAYDDVTQLSVTYINNYPGPPLTDGHVQIPTLISSGNQHSILSKRFHRYLIITGLITILLGFAAVGIQIGIIVSKSILYFYYGFWGGAVILSIGLNTLFMYNHTRTWDYVRLFRSFVWQTIVVGIIFAIGVIIIVTDRCNDSGTEDQGASSTCQHSSRFFNGFLITVFALALAQSVLNSILSRALQYRHTRIANPIV